MQEVACFHCRNIVHITPDADRCSACGEDLKHLLAPDYVSSYFQARAGTLASGGALEEALSEAERGLSYQRTSDLHLLAAIVAQQLGRFDQMRRHVAAIPVDDILRQEAEWLLRSHQARQRARREGVREGIRHGGRGGGAAVAVATLPSTMPTASWLDDFLGRGEPAPAANAPRRTGSGEWWPLVAVPLVVTIVALSYVWFTRDGTDFALWLQSIQSSAGNAPLTAEPSPDRLPTAEPSPTVLANPVIQEAEVSATEAPIAADTDAPVAEEPAIPEVLLPTPTPTPQLPDNLVQRSSQAAEPIADSNPRRAVIISADRFDLDAFLTNAGYADLAALAIDARVRDGELVLQGIVNLDIQRRTLLELVADVPGVQDINAVGLLVRPLPTYVVQEGDTIWSIVYDIYGDVSRIDQFYALNASVLGSPDDLRIGMELRVPPVE